MGEQTLHGSLRFHIINLAAAALVLAGLFVCVRGAVGAVSQIGGVYSGVSGTAREVINGPEVSEEDRVARMGEHVRSMVWGVVPLAVGSLLFAANRTISRREQRRLALEQPGLRM